MPRSYFCNGWMLLNDNPMSKWMGNFITLNDSIEKYTADTCRITLADSGDTIDNGNFKEVNANATILKLYNLGKWIEQELSKIDPNTVNMQEMQSNLDDIDKMFDNEINKLIASTTQLMKEMKFKIAIRDSFYQMTNIWDEYIGMKQNNLNPHCVLRYIEV